MSAQSFAARTLRGPSSVSPSGMSMISALSTVNRTYTLLVERNVQGMC
jgi:hypothetical protein